MCSELRERLGIDDVITLVGWYRHFLRRARVIGKICVDYEAEGVRRRGYRK